MENLHYEEILRRLELMSLETRRIRGGLIEVPYNLRTHWLRFRQDRTQEIYFPVPSKTTPTTILVAVIKAHRNGKTNLDAKTNPNRHLQKTCKKKFKERRKKIIARTGFEPVTLDSLSTIQTLPLNQQGTIDLVVIFGLLTYIGKKKCNKK